MYLHKFMIKGKRYVFLWKTNYFTLTGEFFVDHYVHIGVTDVCKDV